MSRSSHALVLALALGPLAGCYADAGFEVETVPPPPAAQVEVVPASPGPEYVWVEGYHRWDGRAYVWVGGHYDRPPRRGARWERAHWEDRGRRHVWIEGAWR
jgi:hypothetical protein